MRPCPKIKIVNRIGGVNSIVDQVSLHFVSEKKQLMALGSGSGVHSQYRKNKNTNRKTVKGIKSCLAISRWLDQIII